jgi:ribonuclease P protein component
VLPAAARLTSGESFRRCIRAGRRAGSRTLVLHLAGAGDPASSGASAQVGFVVSRAVGNAVGRNRVRRRLRHLVRERLVEVPAGSVVVVRALPAAAGATYDELRADLARCLERVLPPVQSQQAAHHGGAMVPR